MGIWDDIGAGTFSAADSALFGLPGFIADLFGDDAADKARRDWQKEHETATTIGDIAGTVGSLLIPGGAISKGLGKGVGLLGKAATGAKLAKTGEVLGKGAKALDTVGDIIKGAKTIGASVPGIAGKAARAGGSMLRGALGAAEMAAPRALFTDSADEIPMAVGLGSVLGPLSGLVSKGIGKVAGKLGKGSLFKSAGITQKMLDDVATEGLPKSWRMTRAGSKGNLVEEMADYLRANKLYSPAKIEKHLAGNPLGKDVFEKMSQNFGKMGKADKLGAVLSGEEAAGLIKAYGTKGEKAIKSLMGEIGDMDWNQGKAYLKEVAQAAATSGSDAATLARGKAARMIASNLDDVAARMIASNLDDVAARGLSPEELLTARKAYPLRILGEKAVERDAGKIGSGFTAGSPTMEKQGVQKLVSSLLGGGGGVAMSGADLADPSTYPKALLGLGAGALGGGLLSKGLPRAANAIAARLGGDATKAGTLVPKILGQLVGRDEEAGGAAVPGGEGAGSEAGAVSTEAAIEETAAEAGAPEAAETAKAEAKAEVNAKYQEDIASKLRYIWEAKGYNREVSFEGFVKYMGDITTGADGVPFDPRKSAKLLFPDKAERAEYLRQYQVALAYKNTDLEKALGFEGAGKTFGGTVAGMLAGAGAGDVKGYRDRAQQYESLKNVVELLQGKPGSEARSTTLKEIEDEVAAIARLEATPEEKEAAFKRYLTTQGLDPRLLEWGII